MRIAESPGRAPGHSLPTDVLVQKLLGARAARKLYSGSLSGLFNSEQTHERCIVARELVRRWTAEELRREPVLNSPSAVKAYLQLHFAGYEHESFVVMFLDAQNRMISTDELFRGTLTMTSVYPREVVKAALRHNAASVILAHNHPSGVAEPSVQDEALTRALRDALSLVDVKVLDHIVVAAGATTSFAERGLL